MLAYFSPLAPAWAGRQRSQIMPAEAGRPSLSLRVARRWAGGQPGKTIRRAGETFADLAARQDAHVKAIRAAVPGSAGLR